MSPNSSIQRDNRPADLDTLSANWASCSLAVPGDDLRRRRAGIRSASPSPGPDTKRQWRHAEGGTRFVRDSPLTPGAPRSQAPSPFRLSMPHITPGHISFSALQFLPVPVLVLDSLQTVVLANEAMGRMLGLLPQETTDSDVMVSVMDQLRGQSLSQVGIDVVQDGVPVWIDWEQFLDRLALDMGSRKRETTSKEPCSPTTPNLTVNNRSHVGLDGVVPEPPPDTVLEVVVSRRDMTRTAFDPGARSKAATFHAGAKMMISVWDFAENQTYFTLTFTSTESKPPPPPIRRRSAAGIAEAAEKRIILPNSSSPSVASRRDSTPLKLSPGAISLSSSPFPPLGPPSASSLVYTPSMLQKITIMKDALLDNIQTPILAMWRDGSVTIPNRAARSLFNRDIDIDKLADGFDLLPAWTIWTEDFERQLDPSEYPIAKLLRTQTPFTGERIGMFDANGARIVYDVEGVALRDDNTGEFLAGVVSCRDVTKMTEEISRIKAADEERFKLICDTMPQLVWTTTPEGCHDFFNSRWYGYTGLSPEDSLGAGWKNPFHPDDMEETARRWKHSLETGEPYVTEYRCRSASGEWRWFLGRALPLRNKQTGEIEKWFGTCTDVNESINTKIEARRTRQQLLSVIALSHMTMFTVDTNRKVTMLEGALIWDSHCDNNNGGRWWVGEDVYDVFNRLNSQLPEGHVPPFLKPLESILSGQATEDYQEHEIEGRWYRTRFQPVHSKRNHQVPPVEGAIEGVIGIIMDVTELKAREQDIAAQAEEKRLLVANEAAAKEASRLKSQFLANMSHEIRTPITGVIGMAELLLDVELGEEQRELTENIYRSANALLTVINDILDFSKVESGRLDIEEVQFSLSVIVQDVSKMLSFAAERKELDFKSDISADIEGGLVVMGDPGRVRQIITNLLTNSIKFTNHGYVKFSVLRESETAETIEVKFVVEDTGIGIEDEVLERLFQPFSQGDASTARRFGGTGLGLTICKNLLDLMKGRMTLESRPGAGTTATFWIPFNRPQGVTGGGLVHIDPLPRRLQSEMSMSCTSSEYEHMPVPPANELKAPLDRSRSAWRQSSISLATVGLPEVELPASERANIHVLVVEDNAINQQIAIKTIRKLGFQVSAAWNGREALDYLTAAQAGSKRKPDIILMDVQMPVIDGYKCTHLLRHHCPYKAYVSDVPIVAMTASAIQGDKEKCKRAGMDDYLSKPVKSKTLERMLVRWSLKGRLSPSPPEGSAASDCSEMGRHCDTTEIPGGGHDDGDGSVQSPARDGDDKLSLATPRPLPGSETQQPAGFFDMSFSPEASKNVSDEVSSGLLQSVRRFSTDELAMHSRDDKLIDAAGACPVSTPSTPLPTGEALTEENVGKLEEESLRKRLG